MKKITNTEQAGIKAGFLVENVARASYSSRHSGRTAWKSCGFRVRFFVRKFRTFPRVLTAGVRRTSAARPQACCSPAAGPAAEGGSPTNRTREHAGGMFEGKAPNQSADWRERRSKGPDGHRSVRTGGREHAERGPGQHRRLCRPQRSCVSAPYPVSPFLARSAA